MNTLDCFLSGKAVLGQGSSTTLPTGNREHFTSKSFPWWLQHAVLVTYFSVSVKRISIWNLLAGKQQAERELWCGIGRENSKKRTTSLLLSFANMISQTLIRHLATDWSWKLFCNQWWMFPIWDMFNNWYFTLSIPFHLAITLNQSQSSVLWHIHGCVKWIERLL